MRVAICISGQPRHALDAYPFILKNLIEPNQADVFIHMHFDPDNLYMEKSHADNGKCELDGNIASTLFELYKPKGCLVEKPRDFQRPNINIAENRLSRTKEMNRHRNWDDTQHTTYTVKQLTSMYYSIYKANELKEVYANENNFVYDYVIRIRFDAAIMQPIICRNLNPNNIHYIEMGQPDNLISDWLNVGSNAVMNVYASLYLNMEYLNTFLYFKKDERLQNHLEPSDTCGGFSEYMLRDLMCLYKIPKSPLHVGCRIL
jgi:hypothetical protein